MYLEAVEVMDDNSKHCMVISTPVISFAAAANMSIVCTGCKRCVFGSSGADRDIQQAFMVAPTPIISFAAVARKPKRVGASLDLVQSRPGDTNLASSFDMLTVCTGCDCHILTCSGAQPLSSTLQQLLQHVDCVPQDASAMYLEAVEQIEANSKQLMLKLKHIMVVLTPIISFGAAFSTC